MAKSGQEKPEKSGVLTLRIAPDLHADLALTAAELGLDLAELVRLMIRRSLPHYQLEGRLLATIAEEGLGELEAWKRQHPGRPVREFMEHYYMVQRSRWVKELIRLGYDPRFGFEEAYALSLGLDRSSIPGDARLGPPKQQPGG